LTSYYLYELSDLIDSMAQRADECIIEEHQSPVFLMDSLPSKFTKQGYEILKDFEDLSERIYALAEQVEEYEDEQK
jgi:hypothetical protein